MKKLSLILFSLIACVYALAQDTLPRFSVKNVGGNRIIIDWFNKFENIKQISIQRSFDSLKNFKTILTVADPTTPQNGFADVKAENDHMYYRLYILLNGGVFLFSNTQKPVWDTLDPTVRMNGKPDKPYLVVPVISGDSMIGSQMNGRPGGTPWTPSKFVYTYKDGYIRITLPEEDKKYSIKFFTPDDKLIFELKDIKEKNFKIDKTDFYRAGWFKFELYEDDKLLEKNKFYLPKEF